MDMHLQKPFVAVVALKIEIWIISNYFRKWTSTAAPGRHFAIPGNWPQLLLVLYKLSFLAWMLF